MARKVAAHEQKSKYPAPQRLASRVVFPHKKKRRCTATSRGSGKRCPRPCWRGGKFCYLHTGDNASVMGTKGGHRRAIFNPANLEPFAEPKSASEMLKLVAHSVVECRSARLDAKTANAIFAGASVFFNGLDRADHETRLAALEGKQAAGPRNRVNGAGLLRMPN